MRRRRSQPSTDVVGQLPREPVELEQPVGVTIPRPVALRSVAIPRREPRAASRRRNPIDGALLLAEWLIGLVLVAGTGYWLVDGPVRDWMYAEARVADPVAHVQRSAAPRAVTTAAPSAKIVVTSAPPAVAVETGRREKDTADLHTVRPQEVKAERPLVHPELGQALPSSDRAWRRPAVSADYLVPARDFVPPARPTAVPPPAPEPATAGEPAPPRNLRPTHLRAPAVKIDTPVVEVFLQDGAWQVADYAAGYHQGTGLPGDGNVVMAGHKGLRGAVFARLEALSVGDEIFVDATDQRYRYRVRETGNVWPSQVGIMYPTTTPTLTLLTCTNWDMQRFVVIADLVDSAPLQASAGG